MQPGIAAIWLDWGARAAATAALLVDVHDDGLQPVEEREVLLHVVGRNVDRAATVLEREGFTVSDVTADLSLRRPPG